MAELAAAAPQDPGDLRRSNWALDRRSVPAPGRPFTTEAARWSETVLRAERALANCLPEEVADHPLGEAELTHQTGAVLTPTERATRRIIASWLVGALAGDLTPSSSLADAEEWFCETRTLASKLPSMVSQRVHALLVEMVTREGVLDMLPYALDPIPHAYRRDVLRDARVTASRIERKQRGSFFTPSDVAEHIVDLALTRADCNCGSSRVLDPACGTGVFLRAAFAWHLREGGDVDRALQSLYGIDIDECCVEMCAYVLLLDRLLASDDSDARPTIERWREIRSRLLCADTLTALGGVVTTTPLVLTSTTDVPEWLGTQFSVVVSNPPYAGLGDRPDLGQLGDRYRTLDQATRSTDVYAAFLELLCSQLLEGGAGSMIVPMSVAYGTNRSLRRLRETAESVGGTWIFEFFDRTPDALFGDDVKQRTAIVTRTAGTKFSVITSPVMRWTSRNRAGLFARVPSIDLGSLPIGPGVPKVGTNTQAAALHALRARSGRLKRDVVRSRRVIPPVEPSANGIYVAGTAYNWLSVYRDGVSITAGVDQPSQSSVLELAFPTMLRADAVYALLSSRLTYWLWRAEGDAFHVPSGWILRLPIAISELEPDVEARLAELGSALWAGIVNRPVVSRNGGRTTVSFCPHSEPHLLDAIDKVLIVALELPDSFQSALSEFVTDLATAGRDSPTEHGLRRALASWAQE